MAQFRPYNRYTNGIITTDRNNKEFLVLRKPLNLAPSNTDTTIVLTQMFVNRPDLIAEKAYKNPTLWWAICEYNGIYDPFSQLKAGLVIKIPEQNRLITAILALGT